MSSANVLDLSGKVALITGASRGIGRETALQMGAAGARVVVNYNRTPAVPFCHLTFSTVRPALWFARSILAEPGSLGALLQNRRRALRLDVKTTARQLRVPAASYRNWEANRTTPAVWNVPVVVGFLRSDWRPNGSTFGAELRRQRTARGWSLRELARRAGVDWTTIRAWERDTHRATAATLERVEQALGRGRASPL